MRHSAEHPVEPAATPALGLRVASAAYRSRRKIATAAAAVVALLLGYHVVFGQNGLSVYRQKRAEHGELVKQIADLQTQNKRLSDHVQRLGSDPDAIEHEAREKLHYARPGEVIYTLNDKPKK